MAQESHAGLADIYTLQQFFAEMISASQDEKDKMCVGTSHPLAGSLHVAWKTR
jgi:hypothetical protein